MNESKWSKNMISLPPLAFTKRPFHIVSISTVSNSVFRVYMYVYIYIHTNALILIPLVFNY